MTGLSELFVDMSILFQSQDVVAPHPSSCDSFLQRTGMHAITTQSVHFDGNDVWFELLTHKPSGRMEFRDVSCSIKGNTTTFRVAVGCTDDLVEKVSGHPQRHVRSPNYLQYYRIYCLRQEGRKSLNIQWTISIGNRHGLLREKTQGEARLDDVQIVRLNRPSQHKLRVPRLTAGCAPDI